MKTIGVDTVLITQQFKNNAGKTTLRKGLLGIGIEVEDIGKFKKSYKKSMEETLREINYKPKRPVYRSNDLSKIFEYESLDEEYKVLEKFKDLILPKIDKVHFFYTYIYGLSGLVSIYGQSPNYTKIPLISGQEGEQDFYDLISNSYPMICAWELVTQGVESKLLLDNFQGRISPAWNELSGSADLSVYYKGDQCNELIATADLFVKLVKTRMIPNISCFLKEDIKKTASIFGKKCERYFIGKRCLKKIVPHRTAQMKISHLIKHPIIYIIKETPQEEGEEEMIENSPLFNKIVKKVNSLDGCLKYFHPKNDSKNIEEGDLISTFGKRGEKTFKKLNKLGYIIKKF